MFQKIIWKASSSKHDWSNGELLCKLLESALDIGLIGNASWIKIGLDGEKENLQIDDLKQLGKIILEKTPHVTNTIDIEAGGGKPAPWSVTLSIHPFDYELQETETGINFIWLSFDGSLVANSEVSEQLIEAFISIHKPENTEYAFIHPYEHFIDFDEAHYEIPVTISPMFRGIWWANFLGTGHIEHFDITKLASISSYLVKWIEDQGLFLIISSVISDVREKSVEADCLKLTRFFHEALLPGSKWHL